MYRQARGEVIRNGQRVRVVCFGDDFHRVGEVTAIFSGWVFVEFGDGREDRFLPGDLEVWVVR